ncbi:unnamed protein product, partial [Nesidiocoris tenuis]
FIWIQEAKKSFTCTTADIRYIVQRRVVDNKGLSPGARSSRLISHYANRNFFYSYFFMLKASFIVSDKHTRTETQTKRPCKVNRPDFVMTISVPSLWNFSQKSFDSSVTFGSSTIPSPSSWTALENARIGRFQYFHILCKYGNSSIECCCAAGSLSVVETL